jgi:hypothetical protein
MEFQEEQPYFIWVGGCARCNVPETALLVYLTGQFASLLFIGATAGIELSACVLKGCNILIQYRVQPFNPELDSFQEGERFKR